MKKYYVALSFYVEESGDNLEEAKISALNKLRYKGVVHELEAVGITTDSVYGDDWREITEKTGFDKGAEWR